MVSLVKFEPLEGFYIKCAMLHKLKQTKMKKIKNPDYAIKLTREEAINLGINPDIEKQYGEMKTQGPWNICTSFKALCVSKTFEDCGGYKEVTETVLYGLRTMSRPKQGGYELEGYVSIKGKKYSAFTSSQSFNIDGKAVEVSVIHARVR